MRLTRGFGTCDTSLEMAAPALPAPGSFHLTPDTPAVPPFASLTAIPKGFSGAHEIIFFVFIIGGLFAVLRATGSLEAGMASLLRRWGKRC